jgi:[NiFe] hydrogenase assembly HybE family chaperone
MPPRAAALEALFRHIAATRMAGVPVLRADIGVHALGFEPLDGGALGVLVTPWFMNLVFLPPADAPALAVGATRARAVGLHRFEFIGGFEDDFGAWEACSLFSPMHEFADEAAALAVAREVLAELRRAPAQPSRRALLTGSRA